MRGIAVILYSVVLLCGNWYWLRDGEEGLFFGITRILGFVVFLFGSVRIVSFRCGAGVRVGSMVRFGSFLVLAMARFGVWWFFLVRRLYFNSWSRYGR